MLENGFLDVGVEGGRGGAGIAVAVVAWSWCGDLMDVFGCHDG